MIALAVAAIAGPLGLDPVRQPLQVDFLPAERCATCHEQIVADWSASRHRASWTNQLLFEGYVDETLSFCVYCHAPLAEQTREVLANTDFYRSRDPREGIAPGSVAFSPEPTAEEGVTCVVCHMREGNIVAAEPGVGHMGVRVEPALRSSELCASCHEFPFVAVGPQGTHTSADLMQSTWSEWRRWQQETGRAEGCADCHMPDKRHTFRGAYDLDFLKASLRVEERPGGIAVSSVGVGHDLPTGDLFRNLTVEVLEASGQWRTIARIGRTFRTWYDDKTGIIHKGSEADTRLSPGEILEASIPPGSAWRIQYRYGSPLDEQRGRIPMEELAVTLAEGTR